MILIIDVCYKKNSLSKYEFVDPIVRIVKEAGLDYSVEHYTEVEKKSIDDASKIIICGTALHDKYQVDKIESFAWLKGCSKPVLGVCTGMQIIGKMFGCELRECREIEYREIQNIKENILMRENLKVYVMHSLGVIPNENVEILAKDDAATQAIRIIGTEIYAVQFHPEVRNKQVIINFLENAGKP